MAFLKELNIKSFRGVQNLYIQDLGQVNLIVGDNNCGKTSVLEAIELLRTSGNLTNLYRVARQRESLNKLNSNAIYDGFICMFPHDGSELKIEVDGICNDKKILCHVYGQKDTILLDPKELNREILCQFPSFFKEIETDVFKGDMVTAYGNEVKGEKITVNRIASISGVSTLVRDKFKIVYVASYEHLSGSIIAQIVKNDAYKEICLKALQLFDPDILDMKILKSDIGSQAVEYIRHSKLGDMPITTYGDGIKRVLALANAVAAAAGGILLIDEIETSIHKKYYDDIFRFVLKACKAFDVQVFITTHSLEAIDGILATADYDKQDENDPIKVITIKRKDDRSLSRVLTGREVFENRETFGFEVRL